MATSKDHPAKKFKAMIKSTDQQLWSAYAAALEEDKKPPDDVPVRFPRYREEVNKGGVRVSEQEAKLILVLELGKKGFACAAEVPTESTYRFSNKNTKDAGANKRSALTDLVVYKPDGNCLCNMEFKEGGCSCEGKNQESIAKDIEKLLCEGEDGFWFHTLKSVNTKTLGKLWEVFVQALKDKDRKIKKDGGKIQKKHLTFHFAVLNPEFSVERTIKIDPAKSAEDWVKEVVAVKYKVPKGKLTIEDENGWEIQKGRLP